MSVAHNCRKFLRFFTPRSAGRDPAMKRIGVALLFGSGLIVMWASNRGQAQDPSGGVLKNPFADPTPAAPPMNPGDQAPIKPGTPTPSSAQQLFGSGAAQTASPFPDPAMRDPYVLVLEKLKPNPNLALNRDIEVTPQVGPWLIQLTYYQGPEAPQMAREMVSYLRSDAYKLPAYVFNHGTEEKKKEYDRVQRDYIRYKETLAQQKKALAENKEIDTQDIVFASTRVPYIRVEEQVAVVVGGYRDEAAAKRALDQMRNLKPPDPSKVKLAMIYGGERDVKDPKNLKIDKAEIKYLSPFRTAWVARNPTIKSDQPQERDGLELDALKKF